MFITGCDKIKLVKTLTNFKKIGQDYIFKYQIDYHDDIVNMLQQKVQKHLR